MSKTHAFARIILVGVGLLTAIRILPEILTLIYVIPHGKGMAHFGMVMGQIAIVGVSLAALYYVFWVKRDWLTVKIVGTEPSSEPAPSVSWLPAAYRLVCMAAGLHCLYALTFQMTGFLLRSSYTAVARTTPTPADFVNWAILLAAGLYLCWGAPHFVRWQMKRTLEQCRDIIGTG